MNWPAAADGVRKIAKEAGGLPVYWGTGNTIYEPHVVAFTADSWSGEPPGYHVHVYKQGGGYLKPLEGHFVAA